MTYSNQQKATITEKQLHTPGLAESYIWNKAGLNLSVSTQALTLVKQHILNVI